MFRQGDLLFVEVDLSQVHDAKTVKRENGRIILALGETTGHAHAVLDPQVNLFEDSAGNRFLSADAPFKIVHEEHAEVPMSAGVFKVLRQREYSPEAIRTVAD